VYQPASKEQIDQRRQQLRQQRRLRAVKSLWRFACMSGILTGLGWLVFQPNWRISKPEQIQIEGNNYLTDAMIRSMLALSYPAAIVELSPAQMTAQMKERASIVDVKIDRALLPPRLIVRVRDSLPVASLMVDDRTQPLTFVDERGRQLPSSSYRSIVLRSPPKLRVQMPISGTCPNWLHVYRAVRSSPVAIGIVDCRDPQNLFLQTEVGKVRLGDPGDNSRLNSQIQQLDILRNWQKYTNPAAVDYLDLENPNSPKLQIK
jgi:cell division protein FtsQ